MRDQTEWVELIENGVNVLVAANKEILIQEVKRMIDKPSNFEIDLYGTGKASKNIVESLINFGK